MALGNQCDKRRALPTTTADVMSLLSSDEEGHGEDQHKAARWAGPEEMARAAQVADDHQLAVLMPSPERNKEGRRAGGAPVGASVGGQ